MNKDIKIFLLFQKCAQKLNLFKKIKIVMDISN